MTNQELYSKVRTHLLTQMKQSRRHSGSYVECAYRGVGGLRCAIGCLIPDDQYHRSIEGFGAESSCVLRAAGLNKSQGSLAQALQSVHDSREPEFWASALDHVAEQFDLEAR